MKTMKLSQYAKENSVCYRTAWNRYNRGLLNCKQDSLGNILVIIEDDKIVTKRAVLYSRVSSKINSWATINGYEIVKEVQEIASGMNDNKKKLNKILEMEDFDYLIVEHKDRLTRLFLVLRIHIEIQLHT
jgi:predicted site-specific integrase-resolvase